MLFTLPLFSAIGVIVDSIECESFVDINVSLVDMGTTIDEIEKTTDKKGILIEKRLDAISPLLLKIIMAVSQTSNPSQEVISSFETLILYWEKRLYNSIVKLMLRSLVGSFFMLTGIIKKEYHLGSSKVRKVNKTNLLDANFFMRRVLRMFLSKLYNFHRWKLGSCVAAIPSNDDSHEKGRAFTYLDDVSRDPSLYSLVSALAYQCQRYSQKQKKLNNA